MESPEVIRAIREQFELDGDTLIRKSTGMVIVGSPHGNYRIVTVTWAPKRHRLVRLHRLKFIVAHGYAPPIVDHHNRDPSDDSVGNLRPATKRTNAYNSKPYRKRRYDLPRGVYPNRRKGSPRYAAIVTVDMRSVYLGTYDTPEEASCAVEEHLREVHGEFYNKPEDFKLG